MPQTTTPILFKINQQIAYLTLNRADVHNAFNEDMLTCFLEALPKLHEDRNLRALVIQGAGPSFCSGADAQWMRRMVNYTFQENCQDAKKLRDVLLMLKNLPIPILTKVHGATMGGGIGLLACSDIVVSTQNALFGFTEVHLGLIPAIISPFVVEAIGARVAQKLFLTGERFSADYAQKVGLVHEISTPENIEIVVQKNIEYILQGGKEAQKKTKSLFQKIKEKQGLDETGLGEYTVQEIAHRRISTEGQEGLNAFLEKRAPIWQKK